MLKDLVHTRVVSTILIVTCIVISAGLAGYFTNIYKTGSASANEFPVANAGESPLYAYSGVPLTFDGSESYDTDGEIISYEWNFGDGFTGIGLTPSHTYEEQGTFPVELTVTDNDGDVCFLRDENGLLVNSWRYEVEDGEYVWEIH